MSNGAQQEIVKVPRVIVLDLSVTGSAIQLPAVLTVPSDADFEWWFLAAFRTDARLKVLIKETGVGSRDIIQTGITPQTAGFNGILIDNLAGLVASNGAFPIAVPYVMPANRTYQHLFTDTSTATNVVQLAYHGFALLSVPAGSSSGS